MGLRISLLLLVLTAILVALELRERFVVEAALSRARMLAGGGRDNEAVSLLELAASQGCRLGGNRRLGLRYYLIGLLMERGRFAEAAIQCKGMLSGRLRPAMEATIRSRLADCLLETGDAAGAESERASASRALEGAPPDAERWLAEARLCENTDRFDEACVLLERALAILPDSEGPARAMTCARLAVASGRAKRPADAIQWGEAAVALPASATVLAAGHRAACMGYRVIGDPEAAEKHAEAACAAAIAAGNREDTASAMVALGRLQMERGALEAAMATCERAGGMSSLLRSEALMIQSDCLRAWGRFSEALEAVEDALASEPPDIRDGADSRRTAMQLAAAVIEGDAGRPDEALSRLSGDSILIGAQTDPPADRVAECPAVRSWLLALHGDMIESLECARIADALLPGVDDRRLRNACTMHLAGAAAARLDYGLAADMWYRCVALDADPVWAPTAWYGLAEASMALGDRDAALDAYGHAIDIGVDTLHSRLARECREAMLAGDHNA